MTFPARELINQLPQQVRLWLIGADDIPDYFTIDVSPARDEEEEFAEEYAALAEQYADMFSVLGPSAFTVTGADFPFCRLIRRNAFA
jgi:hypothetical protein